MLRAGKLQDVIDTGVSFTWAEAVAVVQQVIACHERERAGAPTAPCLENLWIAPDGAVLCEGGWPALTVGDAAMLLETCLRRAGETNVPGGLRYTLARAMRQVDAPPLDSIAALAMALSRHERAQASAILSDLYSRTIDAAPRTSAAEASPKAVSMPPRTAISERAPTPMRPAREGESERGTRRSAVPERRRNGPAVDALRRELRAADAVLYGAHVWENTGNTGNTGEDVTLFPRRSDLYDPVLVRTAADTQRPPPTFLNGEAPRRHLVRWIVGALTAVLISFGVGYGAAYEWHHREAQSALLEVGSDTPRHVTVDEPPLAGDPFSH
jgi:hypothetical protein